MDLICRSEEKTDFLKTICSMRSNYKNFRDEYKEIERILDNQDESLQQKATAKSKFGRYVQEVWLPTMNSLEQSQGIVMKQFKKSLGKFNLGDSKLETTAKYDNEKGISSESEGKSSINLTGLGIEFLSLFARIGTDVYLMKPNRPLLNSIENVIENIEIKRKFTAILPVKDFANTKFQEIDKILLQIEKEK